MGYAGSANLLVRYLNQGRAEGDRPVTTPRHASRLLLTDAENLRPKETTLLEKIAATCPEMTARADLVRGFATLLKPSEGNDVKLTEWITAARAFDPPHPRSPTNGLEIDRAAIDAGLTAPHHNGRTEGVTTRTKRIMRQIHGRASSRSSATASSFSDHHRVQPPNYGTEPSLGHSRFRPRTGPQARAVRPCGYSGPRGLRGAAFGQRVDVAVTRATVRGRVFRYGLPSAGCGSDCAVTGEVNRSAGMRCRRQPRSARWVRR